MAPKYEILCKRCNKRLKIGDPCLEHGEDHIGFIRRERELSPDDFDVEKYNRESAYRRKANLLFNPDFDLHKTPGIGMKPLAGAPGLKIPVLPEEDYNHPQIDPRTEAQMEAHIIRWKTHISKVLSSKLHKAFGIEGDRISIEILPSLNRLGFDQLVLTAVSDLGSAYHGAAEILIDKLVEFAEIEGPYSKENFNNLRSDIHVAFASYDKSVLEAIRAFRDAQGVDVLLDFIQTKESLGDIWDILMGEHLPGKMLAYTTLPRFAWSEHTEFLFTSWEAEGSWPSQFR